MADPPYIATHVPDRIIFSMEWIKLIKEIATMLPPGILGMVIVVAIALWMNSNKKIPLNISWGKHVNGKTYITAEDMRANCEKRQHALDINLNIISNKLDKILDKQVYHGERIASIEGQLKGQSLHHRSDDR